MSDDEFEWTDWVLFGEKHPEPGDYIQARLICICGKNNPKFEDFFFSMESLPFCYVFEALSIWRKRIIKEKQETSITITKELEEV